MNDISGLDLEALVEHPTRLRAAAAAFALLVAGERPSLTRVAQLAGVSRQNLHQSHKPVVKLVERLREDWKPKPVGQAIELVRERDEARQEAARERRLRKQVQGERDRLMHHLELSDAMLREVSRTASNVKRIRG